MDSLLLFSGRESRCLTLRETCLVCFHQSDPALFLPPQLLPELPRPWCLDMGVPRLPPHGLCHTDPGWTVCPALGSAGRLGVGPETHHTGRCLQDPIGRGSVLFSRCKGFCVGHSTRPFQREEQVTLEIPVFSKWLPPS